MSIERASCMSNTQKEQCLGMHARHVPFQSCPGVRRNKAVRLLANRLYPERFLQDTIADFAASKVKELLPARGQPPPALSAGPVADSRGASEC